MRLKQRIGDFRVRELLVDDFLQEKGEFRVYRVTKRKITTPEALDILAAEAGVDVGKIGLAGWKDRQGITVQYMSIPRGRVVRLQSQELLIDTEGFSSEPFSSEFSRGNAFEINVRNLASSDLTRMRVNLPLLRQFGFVDYFDDQRFGNLIHGQGWIAKDLMLGKHEQALRSMIAAPSPRDNDYFIKFKGSLERCWGDWKACRDVAGRFGAHHSVFEALGRDGEDFKGAFNHVSARFRLIHLYAWQSHLWNRAVTQFMRDCIPLEERVLIDCAEGVLVMPLGEPSAKIQQRSSFRLPGERLEDVEDPVERAAYEDVLAEEGMIADQLQIEGIPGFFMKGEARSLMVKPLHLRVRPALDDPLNFGARMVRIRFELPRGSYASLLIKRLFSHEYRPGAEPMPEPGGSSLQRDHRGYRDGNRRDFGGQGGRGYGDGGARDRGHDQARSPAGPRYRGSDQGHGQERGGWERGRSDGPGARRHGAGRDTGSGGYRERDAVRGQEQRGSYNQRPDAGYHGRDDGQRGGYRGRDDGQRGGYRGRGDQGGWGQQRQGTGGSSHGAQRGSGYRGQEDQRGGGYQGRGFGPRHGGGGQERPNSQHERGREGQRDNRGGDRNRSAGYRGEGDARGAQQGRPEGHGGGYQGRGGQQRQGQMRADGQRGRGERQDRNPASGAGGYRGSGEQGQPGRGGYRRRESLPGSAASGPDNQDQKQPREKDRGTRKPNPRDDQSGGYRKPQPPNQREAPEGQDDGWS